MPITAQRRFKARKALIATAGAAAVAATAVVAAQAASAGEHGREAGQTCEMEALPIPEGFVSTKVSGMSDDGSVIAYYAESPDPDDYGALPLLYSGGEVTEVPIPGDDPQLADVNSAGTGVGFSMVDGRFVPYVWRDGELSELPGGEGQAHGVNEHGDIVGFLRVDTVYSDPVIWPADGSGPVALPMPEHAENGVATAVDDDGTVVGHYSDLADHSGSRKPYMWDADGEGADLPLPEGVEPADVDSVPLDVQGDWASGFLSAPGVEAPGVRWNLSEGTAEMTELGWYEETVAVSADGTVAGHVYGLPTAAYQSGSVVTELPGALDPAENLNYDNAEAISADGSLIAGNVVVGYDEFGMETQNAVVWACA